MAPHPSVLAWRLPGAGEPGGLPSTGSHRVDTTAATSQQRGTWEPHCTLGPSVSPGATVVENPPANARDTEARVRSLGREEPLEEEMATTPVFLPGESHGQRSLVGHSPWVRGELDTTAQSSLLCLRNCVYQLIQSSLKKEKKHVG